MGVDYTAAWQSRVSAMRTTQVDDCGSQGHTKSPEQIQEMLDLASIISGEPAQLQGTMYNPVNGVTTIYINK